MPSEPNRVSDESRSIVIDEHDELSDAELGDLLGPDFPLDGEDAFDTEDATDLDIGGETDELADGTDDDGGSVDVGADTEELLPVEDDMSRDDEDDEADLSLDDGALPEAVELVRGDDLEGPEGPLGELRVPQMPMLEVEDELEGVIESESLPAAWATGDEPRPPTAATHLIELTTSLALEACSALAVADGVVVAASTDLFWFAAGSLTPLRLEAGSSRIRSLALTKTGWDYAVCATASGRLLRRGRLAAASEELRGLRDLLQIGATGPELFELCQPGSGFPHALLVRSGRGALLRSDDDALTFRRVTDQRVRAVSAQGSPSLALTFDGKLLQSDDGGGSFQERLLPSSVREIIQGDAPMVAGHAVAVVLAEPTLGVAVSGDRGKTFVRVPGTSGVSAVCASEFAGRTYAWAALYDEVDRGLVVQIDPTTGHAETVLVLDFESSDDDESGEFARVARIEWDSVNSRLWLAGGFGVKAFAHAAAPRD